MAGDGIILIDVIVVSAPRRLRSTKGNNNLAPLSGKKKDCPNRHKVDDRAKRQKKLKMARRKGMHAVLQYDTQTGPRNKSRKGRKLDGPG